MAAQVLELFGTEAVRLARPAQMVTEPGALGLPGADTDVDVVSFGKHPAVSTRNVGKLDDRSPGEAIMRNAAVCDVALERDAMDDALPETERARGDPIRTVSTDHDIGLDRHTVDAHRIAKSDAGSFTNVDAARLRGIKQELVQATSLRHPDHRLARAAHHRVAEAKPQLDDVDLLFNHRHRIDRAMA